jgi:hypothetical protein
MPPTAEDMQRYRRELKAQGYCLVHDALPLATFDELRATLVRLAAEEIANGTDYVYENGSNQRVWGRVEMWRGGVG